MIGWKNEEELLTSVLRSTMEGAKQCTPPEIIVPNGDDAAVLQLRAGQQLVATVDAFIERRHFDLSYFSLVQVGKKAVEAAASDIIAMGGVPICCLCSLSFSRDFEKNSTEELYKGIYQALDRLGAALIGGNLAHSDAGLSLHLTFLGEVSQGAALTRGGAHKGDLLVVSGALGASAAGLEILREAKHAARFPELVRVHLEPRCRNDLLPYLSQGVHSLMDLSDGLSTDLARLCKASGVGATIDMESLPLSAELRRYAEERGVSAHEYALHGGEDYQLLAAVSEKPSWGMVIGEVTDGEIILKTAAGKKPLVARGFDHFRTS